MDKRFTNIQHPIEGFSDIYGHEARVKHFVASKLSELFQLWGYEQITFPIVEKASSFSEQVIGGSPWPEWDKRGVFYLHIHNYQTTYSDIPDQVPALLIPEGTISVSRWLAKEITSAREKGEEYMYPRKVFYMTPSFRNELIDKLSDTKKREFTQVGLEILGTSNNFADAEVVNLICEGFKSIEVPSSAITARIGSVELFNALCDDGGVDEQARLRLKNLMDTIAEAKAGKEPERLDPCVKEVDDIIADQVADEAVRAKWKIMYSVYETHIDKTIIDKLGYPELIQPLNDMSAMLKERGYKCIIDFSVVRSHEYYTGIVYEIDLKIGEVVHVEVAGGGRYNRLIGSFLESEEQVVAAVGFAYGLERICEVFEHFQKGKTETKSMTHWVSEQPVDEVLFSEKKTFQEYAKLFGKAEKERKGDKRIDIYVGDNTTKAGVTQYAKTFGVTEVRT